MARRDQTKLMNNRRMNDAVYQLRHQVMNVIYQARRVAELPRVDVRIGDSTDGTLLGVARMGANIIWIDSSMIEQRPDQVLQVVLHELCHAVWSVDHDEDCPLMCSVIRDIPDDRAWNVFKQYAIKNEALI